MLSFAARTYRFGFLFLQNVYDTLYGASLYSEPLVEAHPSLWADLDFWRRLLRSAQHSGGITRQYLQDRLLRPESLVGVQHLYTDASTSYGWAGVLGPRMIYSPWELAGR